MRDDHARRRHATQRARVQQTAIQGVDTGHTVADRVDDLGNQLAGLDVFARHRAKHQQAADRRCHRLDRSQWRSGVEQFGRRRQFSVDEASVGQVMNDRLTVAAGQRMVDIALAAQLQGHRKTAHRYRKPLTKALLQLPPHQREAFIERLAARIGGQQARLGAQVSRQHLDVRPGLRRGV